MPLSLLHEEIASATKGRGAMYIAGYALKALLLDSFQRAATTLIGCAFPTLHPKVTARLDGFSVDVKALTITLGQDATTGQVTASLSQSFDIQLALLYSDDFTMKFVDVVFSVAQPQFSIATNGSSIRMILDSPSITSVVTDNPPGSREKAILASGIDPVDLLRIEGAFAYGTGERLIESAIGRPPLLDLHELFPAIEFSHEIELEVIRGSLLVIPASMSVIQDVGCPQGDASKGIAISPQIPQGGGNAREWSFHAVMPDSPIPKPLHEDPATALHLPLKLLQARFEGNLAPAVVYRERDNGFIGYDVQISCAVKEIVVSVDEVERALRLRLGFNAWGTLIADMDVPCIGRVDLATARIELPEGDKWAYIDAQIKFAVDSAGQLLAVTEVVGLDLKKARVVVDLAGRYVPGGIAKLYAFILDGVIGRIMAHNLPPLVSATIRENLNRNFFVMTRLDGLSKFIDHPPNRACFSGDQAQVLVGSSYLG